MDSSEAEDICLSILRITPDLFRSNIKSVLQTTKYILKTFPENFLKVFFVFLKGDDTTANQASMAIKLICETIDKSSTNHLFREVYQSLFVQTLEVMVLSEFSSVRNDLCSLLRLVAERLPLSFVLAEINKSWDRRPPPGIEFAHFLGDVAKHENDSNVGSILDSFEALFLKSQHIVLSKKLNSLRVAYLVFACQVAYNYYALLNTHEGAFAPVSLLSHGGDSRSHGQARTPRSTHDGPISFGRPYLQVPTSKRPKWGDATQIVFPFPVPGEGDLLSPFVPTLTGLTRLLVGAFNMLMAEDLSEPLCKRGFLALSQITLLLSQDAVELYSHPMLNVLIATGKRRADTFLFTAPFLHSLIVETIKQEWSSPDFQKSLPESEFSSFDDMSSSADTQTPGSQHTTIGLTTNQIKRILNVILQNKLLAEPFSKTKHHKCLEYQQSCVRRMCLYKSSCVLSILSNAYLRPSPVKKKVALVLLTDIASWFSKVDVKGTPIVTPLPTTHVFFEERSAESQAEASPRPLLSSVDDSVKKIIEKIRQQLCGNLNQRGIDQDMKLMITRFILVIADLGLMKIDESEVFMKFLFQNIISSKSLKFARKLRRLSVRSLKLVAGHSEENESLVISAALAFVPHVNELLSLGAFAELLYGIIELNLKRSRQKIIRMFSDHAQTDPPDLQKKPQQILGGSLSSLKAPPIGTIMSQLLFSLTDYAIRGKLSCDEGAAFLNILNLLKILSFGHHKIPDDTIASDIQELLGIILGETPTPQTEEVAKQYSQISMESTRPNNLLSNSQFRFFPNFSRVFPPHIHRHCTIGLPFIPGSGQRQAYSFLAYLPRIHHCYPAFEATEPCLDRCARCGATRDRFEEITGYSKSVSWKETLENKYILKATKEWSVLPPTLHRDTVFIRITSKIISAEDSEAFSLNVFRGLLEYKKIALANGSFELSNAVTRYLAAICLSHTCKSWISDEIENLLIMKYPPTFDVLQQVDLSFFFAVISRQHFDLVFKKLFMLLKKKRGKVPICFGMATLTNVFVANSDRPRVRKSLTKYLNMLINFLTKRTPRELPKRCRYFALRSLEILFGIHRSPFCCELSKYSRVVAVILIENFKMPFPAPLTETRPNTFVSLELPSPSDSKLSEGSPLTYRGLIEAPKAEYAQLLERSDSSRKWYRRVCCFGILTALFRIPFVPTKLETVTFMHSLGIFSIPGKSALLTLPQLLEPAAGQESECSLKIILPSVFFLANATFSIIRSRNMPIFMMRVLCSVQPLLFESKRTAQRSSAFLTFLLKWVNEYYTQLGSGAAHGAPLVAPAKDAPGPSDAPDDTKTASDSKIDEFRHRAWTKQGDLSTDSLEAKALLELFASLIMSSCSFNPLIRCRSASALFHACDLWETLFGVSSTTLLDIDKTAIIRQIESEDEDLAQNSIMRLCSAISSTIPQDSVFKIFSRLLSLLKQKGRPHISKLTLSFAASTILAFPKTPHITVEKSEFNTVCNTIMRLMSTCSKNILPNIFSMFSSVASISMSNVMEFIFSGPNPSLSFTLIKRLAGNATIAKRMISFILFSVLFGERGEDSLLPTIPSEAPPGFYFSEYIQRSQSSFWKRVKTKDILRALSIVIVRAPQKLWNAGSKTLNNLMAFMLLFFSHIFVSNEPLKDFNVVTEGLFSSIVKIADVGRLNNYTWKLESILSADSKNPGVFLQFLENTVGQVICEKGCDSVYEFLAQFPRIEGYRIAYIFSLQISASVSFDERPIRALFEIVEREDVGEFDVRELSSILFAFRAVVGISKDTFMHNAPLVLRFLEASISSNQFVCQDALDTLGQFLPSLQGTCDAEYLERLTAAALRIVQTTTSNNVRQAGFSCISGCVYALRAQGLGLRLRELAPRLLPPLFLHCSWKPPKRRNNITILLIAACFGMDVSWDGAKDAPFRTVFERFADCGLPSMKLTLAFFKDNLPDFEKTFLDYSFACADDPSLQSRLRNLNLAKVLLQSLETPDARWISLLLKFLKDENPSVSTRSARYMIHALAPPPSGSGSASPKEPHGF
eukprot:gnl/Chilomastix_cuspidata/2288.p1 GENE.gnl/Chilomastix_cuspidata/2288~~gnl/Chilomastix_cuspidata/2288.p1  ORF type:complete len:2032 (-),score=611.81 gnl/Chilomastix_cuspidata/2288:75-6170(-)